MSATRLTFLLLGGVLLGLLSSRIIQQYQSLPVLWSSNIFYGKQTQLSQAATHIGSSRVDDHRVSIVSVDPLVLYIQNFVTAEEASSLIKLVSVHPISIITLNAHLHPTSQQRRLLQTIRNLVQRWQRRQSRQRSPRLQLGIPQHFRTNRPNHTRASKKHPRLRQRRRCRTAESTQIRDRRPL